MSKLVRSTVLSHIGIFNSNSSIFHWEHPHVMHNGKKRDVVILQVLPHDEERFLVEFIFNEDAEFVFGDDYDIVKMKKIMDERCEDAKSMYPYPEHFILTDIKKQECISADSCIANQSALDEQYMREVVCDKLSKALNKGDDPGEPGQVGCIYVEGYGENKQDTSQNIIEALEKENERIVAEMNGMKSGTILSENMKKAIEEDEPDEPGLNGYSYAEGSDENE